MWYLLPIHNYMKHKNLKKIFSKSLDPNADPDPGGKSNPNPEIHCFPVYVPMVYIVGLISTSIRFTSYCNSSGLMTSLCGRSTAQRTNLLLPAKSLKISMRLGTIGKWPLLSRCICGSVSG
jgi:hypothetical protein